LNTPLKDNRWCVSESQFAVRIVIPDLKGFFAALPVIGSIPNSRSLVIEPGTLAVVIDDGFLVGQMAAGSYTLESFVDRLQFWKHKQATVFLTRAEDVPIETEIRQIPSLEGACVDVGFRWTVQVRDVMQFAFNLMGARSSLSVVELNDLLSPLVTQAAYSTIAQMSWEETQAPNLHDRLEDGLRLRTDSKLQRYGLDLVDVQSAKIQSDGDEFRKREGETWLKSRELEIQRAASNVENEQLRERTADLKTKLPIRQQLRQAISEGELSELQSVEDFKTALLEIDKARVLRREELDALVETYNQRKQDRASLQKHLLATLDLGRERDIEELKIEIEHAVRMKALAAEDEITKHSQSREVDAWRHRIEAERTEANHRREQKFQSIAERLSRVREVNRQRRDDAYDDILHQQRMEEIESDLEYAQAKRKDELALAQAQLNARLEAERLESQKRQQEWELDYKDRKSLSQIERLRQVQTMNAEVAERQQRLQVDMENLRQDSASKRELERISVLGGLSTEAMIALAGTENAALLADLKKHEATQVAVSVQASSSQQSTINDERLRMYERMNEVERAKANAIADAYKLAMQSQQGNVNQMISGLAGAATSQTSITTNHSIPNSTQPLASPPPMPSQVTWYVSLEGKQSPPLTMSQVQEYVASGQVNSQTMVWKQGMKEWAIAQSVPEIASLLDSVASSMPPGPPPL
jgi:membrane protease subunit (stomatin/prohibitin family)